MVEALLFRLLSLSSVVPTGTDHRKAMICRVEVPAVVTSTKPGLEWDVSSVEPELLRRLELFAECLNACALLGKRSDEFKSVQKTHAVTNHRPHHENLGNIRNRKFQRNHFSRGQFAGNHGAQSGRGNLEAAAVNADVSLRPQYLHHHRYLRAIAGITSGSRLVHASNLRQSGSTLSAIPIP